MNLIENVRKYIQKGELQEEELQEEELQDKTSLQPNELLEDVQLFEEIIRLTANDKYQILWTGINQEEAEWTDDNSMKICTVVDTITLFYISQYRTFDRDVDILKLRYKSDDSRILAEFSDYTLDSENECIIMNTVINTHNANNIIKTVYNLIDVNEEKRKEKDEISKYKERERSELSNIRNSFLKYNLHNLNDKNISFINNLTEIQTLENFNYKRELLFKDLENNIDFPLLQECPKELLTDLQKIEDLMVGTRQVQSDLQKRNLNICVDFVVFSQCLISPRFYILLSNGEQINLRLPTYKERLKIPLLDSEVLNECSMDVIGTHYTGHELCGKISDDAFKDKYYLFSTMTKGVSGTKIYDTHSIERYQGREYLIEDYFNSETYNDFLDLLTDIVLFSLSENVSSLEMYNMYGPGLYHLIDNEEEKED